MLMWVVRKRKERKHAQPIYCNDVMIQKSKKVKCEVHRPVPTLQVTTNFSSFWSGFWSGLSVTM